MFSALHLFDFLVFVGCDRGKAFDTYLIIVPIGVEISSPRKPYGEVKSACGGDCE